MSATSRSKEKEQKREELIQTWQKRSRVLIPLMTLVVGLVGGYVGHSLAVSSSISVKRANEKDLTFTNPLLSCSISENKEFAEYKPWEKNITSYLNTVDQSKVGTVSVYYRDLKSGRWFGTNEDQKYSPASLLKVPVMIAYLKEAENDPSVLTKALRFNRESEVSNSLETYKSPNTVVTGRTYTVDQLITYMIANSDNNALKLLVDNTDQNSLDDVYSDIGLQAHTAATDDFITAKSYAYIFRLLYNSTYLSWNLSEKALKILSESDFTHGLTQGLPASIKVAHKFGERTVVDGNTYQVTERELHDCGIVYYPNHPYVLCIMTKGQDFNSLSATIGQVSKIVYTEVNKEYGEVK